MASQVSLRVLTEDDIKQVHESSLRLLQEVGIEIEYQPAVDILRDAGQRVEGPVFILTPILFRKRSLKLQKNLLYMLVTRSSTFR